MFIGHSVLSSNLQDIMRVLFTLLLRSMWLIFYDKNETLGNLNSHYQIMQCNDNRNRLSISHYYP
jgi:hypothetical protein